MELSQRLRLWSDELRAIANAGLHWDGDDPYALRRFQRVLRIAAEIFAAQDTRDADAIKRRYRGDLAHTAPYPCGDAAIFNARGEILLIQRADNIWQMIDFQPILAGAMYGPLRDLSLFNQVRIDPEVHTLVWPNGADFDPATLHDWPGYAAELAARAKMGAHIDEFPTITHHPSLKTDSRGAT